MKSGHLLSRVFGVKLCVVALAFTTASLAEGTIPNSRTLSFEDAISIALLQDPWLEGNRQSQSSIESRSSAAGTLPDPSISMGLANLPTDSFDTDQEGMTQFKIGISQMFPRGDSLEIQKALLSTLANSHPYQRKNREAEVTVTVGKLWLEAYKAQESIRLIHNNYSLFEQMVGVAESSYSSAIGRTRQHDVIRAQLELTRLDDRVTKLKQHQEVALSNLSEWILSSDDEKAQQTIFQHVPNILLPSSAPIISVAQAGWLNKIELELSEPLINQILDHPAILAVDQKIDAQVQGVRLAKQKYKPSWGINASYGLRQSDQMGNERSDLLSVGLSFDLPIFTENRQDQEVKSAVSMAEMVKTERSQVLRKMVAMFESTRVQILRLNERQALYQNQLIPQMHQQAEASLTAYTNDDGDFAEAVRARIAVLNAEIEALEIHVEQLKATLQLNYFLVSGK